MHPIATTLTLAVATANGYAQSQAAALGVPLTLNGSLVTNGIGTPDAPRRVVIASSGNDSGITFTIVGTSRPQQGGGVQTETIAGANAGTATSTQDFATVKSITPSGASAGTVTSGTSAIGSGPWVPWDQFPSNFQVSAYGYVLSGTPTWQLDYTYDDVFGLWLPPNIAFPRPIPHQGLVGSTGNAEGFITQPVRASRLTITAGAGSVQLTQIQQGP